MGWTSATGWSSSGWNKPPVVVGGGAYVGPGDVVASPLLFYGMRAVTAAYATAGSPLFDVEDSGGLNAATINALSTGGPDMTTLNAWIVAHGTASVHKLYDQVGTQHLITASSVATEPTIQQSAIGTIPSLKFVKASSQALRVFPGITQALPMTTSTVSNRTGSLTTNNSVFAVSDTNGPLVLYSNAANTGNLYNGTGAAFTSGVSDNAWLAMQVAWISGASTVLVNGSSTTSLNSGTNAATNANAIQIGSDAIGPFPMDGQIMECGLWAGTTSGANQSALEANQRAWYGF